MKKTILSAILACFSIAAMAQTQPDAEYLLIRRSYKAYNDTALDIRFRKEIKLLRNRAITAYADKGETFITYNPEFESLTINECYTIRADGSKVVTPANAFVQQLPGNCTDCGRLNGLREMAIVHTAIEYGCTIVLDYTIHRRSPLLVERFNLQQDCPVHRYEIRYADGHTQVEQNLPQMVNDPYMPAKKGYDVEFQLGNISPESYVAPNRLPVAAKTLALLKEQAGDNDKSHVAAIRDWVVDYVRLSTVNLSHLDYDMTPAELVYQSNCGTALDKSGLLAAMLNEAGFHATLDVSYLNVFGDKPFEVVVEVNGQTYRINALTKGDLLTEQQRVDAAAVAAAPKYIDRALDWSPEMLADGYCRITLPDEPGTLDIDPALLAPSRTSDVQVGAISEFYHYTLNIPKKAKLIGGDVELEYTRSVGSISIIIKQKGNRILITRSLRLTKPLITRADYAGFRQLMIDWYSHRELFFSL